MTSSVSIADGVKMLLILAYALLCPEASKYFSIKLAHTPLSLWLKTIFCLLPCLTSAQQ